MDQHHLLQDLAVIMLAAGVATVVFRQLRQPVVLGYIVAGFLIGPHTPPFSLIGDTHTIQSIAELGVVMLMFSLGLHFSVSKLAGVGGTASSAALLEIVGMLVLGFAMGLAFGWSRMDSIFLGAILSISSTTIIVKALEDLRLSREKFAENVFGILIVEDIAAILILTLLSSVALTGTLSLFDVADTGTRLAIFLVFVMVGGLMGAPKLLGYLVRFRSNEMLLVALLALCFGVSLLAMKLGYSVALGAFLVGAVVAETRQGPRAQELVEPVRDMFSAVFFVAVGMLIDPRVLLEYAVPIALISLAVIFGKVICCSLGAFLGGAAPRDAMRMGLSLAQIGEFSFIIATLGESLDVTSGFLYPIAVAVSAITTLTTPYLITHADWITSQVARLAPAALRESARVYSESRPLSAMQARDQLGRRVLRRSLITVLLNLLIAAGLFLLASRLELEAAPWMPVLPEWTGGIKTLLWLAAVALSLPLYVASVRKLNAMAMIIAEMSIDRELPEERKAARRQLLSAGLLGLLTFVFMSAIVLFSYALLPPWPVLLVLLVMLAIVVAYQWNRLVRVYARAQASLRDTLADTVAEEGHAPAPVRELLHTAGLRTVGIEAGAIAAGKLIRELEVRRHTGAYIIGIERDGEAMINPSPDEEILTGDKVVLLGEDTQLNAASDLLLSR